MSQNDLLLASSWDNHVRCWQVNKQGGLGATLAGQATHDGPVLSTCFNGDGSAAISGGADNTVRVWQFAGGAGATVVGRHDQPVKSVHWVPNLNMIVSGSWDRTIRFWDMRSPTEAFKLQLNQKVYAMDVNFPLMTVSTAETGGPQANPLIHVYSLQNGQPQLFNNTAIVSTLKHQPRCVSIFNNQRQGYALGSVEGRVEIKDLAPPAEKSFAFKSHRIKDQAQQRGTKDFHHVYPVNDIKFNSRGTFATVGGDGVVNFWDKEAKTRLNELKPGVGCRVAQAVPQGQPPHPISACAFGPQCDVFAYATSYDWSRGDDAGMKSRPNDVWLHAMTQKDLNPPPKGRK